MISDVYNFWNSRPCNIRHSDKEIGTREYFLEVSKKKYKVEPHILKFAEFEKWANKDVLEVGCGIGTAAQSFIENGANYTGLDISDYSIEIAKKRLEVFGLDGKLLVHNIEEPIQGQFDLVYSFGVLHHTPNMEKAIDTIYKALRRGGEFRLMLYATNSLKNYQIMDGLDQFEAQSNVPIAKTFTHDEVRVCLSKFTQIEITQTHIFPYKIDEYKRHEYVLQDYYETMPKPMFDCLEKHLGWHLCIKAVKPL
jgi:2-polyprenyl-3-methyl-5-hydroxy-6-metoxy-1,4-benzoquinol methylase